MVLKLIKMLIGKLSEKDKQALMSFIEGLLKAAAAGAAEGCVKGKSGR